MTIDFTKLLGFNTVADQVSGRLDLQDDTFSDKLGAKIGPPEGHSPPRVVDFKDETFGAKLGAKMGPEIESTNPSEQGECKG